MAPEVEAALISAMVSLVVGAISGYFAFQREKRKWLTDLKTGFQAELYKTRLENYPKIYGIIGKLSSRAPELLNPEGGRQIGYEINDWFYSIGGLCADANTRAALIRLREACLSWTQGSIPPELIARCDDTLLLLRRDLDLQGLESFDLKNRKSLLEMLKADIASLERGEKRRYRLFPKRGKATKSN